MKKFFKIVLVLAVLCLMLGAGAYASGEPSGETSAEPVADVSGEPSAAHAQKTTTFVYNGVEYTIPVYTFNGEEYVKIEDLKTVLSDEEEAASDEPVAEASGEASAEPAVEASGEPSEEVAVENSFDVTIRVNGSDYAVAPVTASVNGNTYTFQIGELLAAFGLELVYDEATNVASLKADIASLLGAIMIQEATQDPSASAEPAASGEPMMEEPVASEEPASATEEPAAAEAVPATSGTENEANVLVSAAQPATAEEHDAYEAYLAEYMNAYTGVGDGTFDDSARLMALGELDGVSFGSDVNAFPFEMFVTQFGAMDFAAYIASVAPAVAAAADESVPATDGTENRSNVLTSAVQPATVEEHDAYEAYLMEYMNAYTGVGDGTFDDGARLMALGELDGVSFGSDVNAFPFEMFVTQFGAMDYATFTANN